MMVYHMLVFPNPRTDNMDERPQRLKKQFNALDVETVIFDDELSPG